MALCIKKLTPTPTISHGISVYSATFPHPIISFKHWYFGFKMKIITYLNSANRLSLIHLFRVTMFIRGFGTLIPITHFTCQNCVTRWRFKRLSKLFVSIDLVINGHAQWLKYRICERHIMNSNPTGVFVPID